MRKADATLDQWFRRGAGALRQQVDDLQVGLKKLSANLEQLERSRRSTESGKAPRPASKSSGKRTHAAAPRKTARPRRQKKAA